MLIRNILPVVAIIELVLVQEKLLVTVDAVSNITVVDQDTK